MRTLCKWIQDLLLYLWKILFLIILKLIWAILNSVSYYFKINMRNINHHVAHHELQWSHHVAQWSHHVALPRGMMYYHVIIRLPNKIVKGKTWSRGSMYISYVLSIHEVSHKSTFPQKWKGNSMYTMTLLRKAY